jgi:hypothetical protein
LDGLQFKSKKTIIACKTLGDIVLIFWPNIFLIKAWYHTLGHVCKFAQRRESCRGIVIFFTKPEAKSTNVLCNFKKIVAPSSVNTGWWQARYVRARGLPSTLYPLLMGLEAIFFQPYPTQLSLTLLFKLLGFLDITGWRSNSFF